MDGKNQASLRLMYRQAKRLLAHLRPRRGRASIVFGFEEPYTTGQVLAAASLLYPLYCRRIVISPVFDRAVFEAEGSLGGRIRVSTLLWLLFGLLRDRHTRRLVMRLAGRN